MMGRVDDIAGPDNDAMVMYAGFATGGLWKTQDAGAHWRPTFDQQPNQSIGAIGVAATNANIVYVGTGEANNRQRLDNRRRHVGLHQGGEHWTHLGLENTQTIGKIVVDPTNSGRRGHRFKSCHPDHLKPVRGSEVQRPTRVAPGQFLPGARGQFPRVADIAEPTGPAGHHPGPKRAPNPPSPPTSVCLPQRRQAFRFGSGVSCRRIHECHPRRHFQGLLMRLDVTPVGADEADAEVAFTGETATAVCALGPAARPLRARWLGCSGERPHRFPRGERARRTSRSNAWPVFRERRREHRMSAAATAALVIRPDPG